MNRAAKKRRAKRRSVQYHLERLVDAMDPKPHPAGRLYHGKDRHFGKQR